MRFFHHGVARAPTGGRLFLIGWAFAFGQLLSGLYWLGHAFLVDAEEFLWALPFAVTLLPAGLALFAGAAVWLWGVVCRHRALAAYPFGGKLVGFLLLAFFWSAGEVARSHLLTGFPWNLPTMVFGNWIYAAQPVAWVGIHGLGLMALIAAALIAYPACARVWPASALLWRFSRQGPRGSRCWKPQPQRPVNRFC